MARNGCAYSALSTLHVLLQSQHAYSLLPITQRCSNRRKRLLLLTNQRGHSRPPNVANQSPQAIESTQRGQPIKRRDRNGQATPTYARTHCSMNVALHVPYYGGVLGMGQGSQYARGHCLEIILQISQNRKLFLFYICLLFDIRCFQFVYS